MRRKIAVCAVALIAAAVAGAWWANDGEELDLSLGHGVVVEMGEPMYVGVLPISSGEVHLRTASVRSVEGTSSDELAVEVLAVRQAPGQSGIGSQLNISGYERLAIGEVVAERRDQVDPRPPFDWLVVEIRADESGAWTISQLEAEYRSGWNRARTATSIGEICVLAVDDRAALEWPGWGQEEPPSGVDARHWAEYRQCAGWPAVP